MKTIKNSIAIIAFVVAGFAAFAFNAPSGHEEQMLFTQLENGQWIPAEAGSTCEQSSEICKAELVNNDPQLGEIVPGSEIRGSYNAE